MIAHGVNILKRAPSHRDELNAELEAIKTSQLSLMPELSERWSACRSRLVFLACDYGRTV
jgi:hypothetical protein